jgi:hypothetical protein
MKTHFLKEASEEFIESVDYYNKERPGLGYEFALEVKNALKRIRRYIMSPENRTAKLT